MRRPLATCAILLALSVTGCKDDSSHKAAAEETLKAAGTESTLAAAIDQSLDMQIKANPNMAQFRPTMKKFFDKHLSFNALKDDMIKIYVAEFTEDELKEITKFYQTPVGKKMVAKMPKLTGAGMQLGMKRVQDNQAELVKMLEDARKKQ